jgi:hypothetical protein
MELRMKDEGTEIASIVKRLEDRSVEVPSEVDLALDTIAKAQPDDEVADVPCCNKTWHSYSSGAMGFNA